MSRQHGYNTRKKHTRKNDSRDSHGRMTRMARTVARMPRWLADLADLLKHEMAK